MVDVKSRYDDIPMRHWQTLRHIAGMVPESVEFCWVKQVVGLLKQTPKRVRQPLAAS